ncbi:hypothetical protein [Flavitalea sp. BT771]
MNYIKYICICNKINILNLHLLNITRVFNRITALSILLPLFIHP